MALVGAILFASIISWAHPVTYKDGVAVTSLNQTFATDGSVAYTFRREAAVAARFMKFDDRIGRMEYYAPQVNIRLNRWNYEEAQANIYFMGGVGAMNYNEHTHSAILTGLEADAESRVLYASARAEKMWTGYTDFWHLQSRVGVAPYKAGYNQVATWLMAQYDYNPLLRQKYKITPLVRLFYRTVLVESGVSLDGDWMVNLMVHL